MTTEQIIYYGNKMEKISTAVDIQVGAKDAGGTVKSIKTELREAKENAIAMARAFGDASPEAAKAAASVANLKDQMQDLGKRVEAFNPDKFERLAKLGSGIANGFVAAQGAMALFGGESRELEKQMIKLQGAIALSQGIQGLKDLKEQFASVGSVAVKAFQGIKGAILATGIGALVVLLGVVVAYWDDIKEAVSGVSTEQKKIVTLTEEDVKLQQDKLKHISDQDNVLRLQGQTELQILQYKKEQTLELVKAMTVAIAAQESLLNTQAIANVKKLSGRFGWLNNYLFGTSTDKLQEERESIDALKQNLDTALNEIAGYTIQQNNIVSAAEIKSADTTKAANEKAAAERKAAAKLAFDESQKDIIFQDGQRKLHDDAFNKNLSDNAKIQYDIAVNAEKDTQAEVARLQAIEDERVRFREENQLKAEQTLLQAKANMIATGLESIADIYTAFSGQSEEQQKRAFNLNKAVSIATAIIDGIMATQAAYKNALQNPLTKLMPDGGLTFAAIVATTSAAASAARIALLAKTQYNSTAISSPTSPTASGGRTAPNLTAIGNTPNNTGNLTGATGTQQQGATKIYVTETDISSAQNRVREIKRRALIR